LLPSETHAFDDLAKPTDTHAFIAVRFLENFSDGSSDWGEVSPEDSKEKESSW